MLFQRTQVRNLILMMYEIGTGLNMAQNNQKERSTFGKYYDDDDFDIASLSKSQESHQ